MNAALKPVPDTEHYDFTPAPRGDRVVVTDVEIPFGSMVTLFVKVGLALIPAVLIVLMLWSVGAALLSPILNALVRS